MNCGKTERVNTIVLCLGNDLLTDDGIGMLAAERLEHELPDTVKVVATAQSGLALLDHLIGYDRAIIVDAIHTGHRPAGMILRLSPDDLKFAYAPSPHYAGLPEMFAIADRLAITFPSRIDVLAVEVTDTETIGGTVSKQVMASLDSLVEEVESILKSDRIGAGSHA